MSRSAQTAEYKRNLLYQNEMFEVAVLEWSSADISELHGHGWSQCMILVQEGIFENTVDLGFKTEIQVLEKGQVAVTPTGAKHKLRCLSSTGKTLHVYTPKIGEISDSRKFNGKMDGLEERLKITEALTLSQLRTVMSEIREKSISTHSPMFMNQLFSGVLPQMLMAEELLAQSRSTMATTEASPVFSRIEEEVIGALGELIGWSKAQRQGIAVPGGSAANFMALHCARQRAFPNIRKEGFSGKRFKVYASVDAHYSMKKACIVLGFGSDSLSVVPVDEKGRMNPQALNQMIENDKKNNFQPLMVCATAGTTVFGAFDPLELVSSVCKTHDLWMHVDAAWGGPALFSQTLAPLMKGVQLANSVTFDAHKLFGANLTSSFFLTRHEQILFEANDVSGGDYIFHEGAFDRGRLSWQCGRSAEAVSFWAIWKSVGTAGLGCFADRLVKIREETLMYIKSESRMQLVSDPEYLNICVRIHPPIGHDQDWSKRVRSQLIERDIAMVNYSANSEGSFLRLILAHPYLEFCHVKEILSQALRVE